MSETPDTNKFVFVIPAGMSVKMESSEDVFGRDALDNLVKQPRVKLTSHMQRVFIYFDFRNEKIATIAEVGSETSDVMSYVLVGFESAEFPKTSEIYGLAIKHLEAIRSLPMFEKTPIVFCVEPGSGMNMWVLKQFFERHFKHRTWLTINRADEPQEKVLNFFRDAIKGNRFGIAEDFVSIHQPVDTVLEMWKQQGNSFQNAKCTYQDGHIESIYACDGGMSRLKGGLFDATLCCFYVISTHPF